MSSYTIGIDIGTTGTKTVLLEVDRGIVAQASRESALFSPAPGYAEADPTQWLRNAYETVAEVVSRSGIRADQVFAISTSGMVPAVVATGRASNSLGRALLQNDTRAAQEQLTLADRLSSPNLLELTGSALTQQSVAPKAMWLRDHAPQHWTELTHIVGSYDWLLMALGAEPHVEQNWAIESGLFRLDGTALEEVFTAAGLDASIIPDVLVPGSIAGRLSHEAAERTGLAAGTPLVVGGADHVLSAFAAGVGKEGDALIKLGGAGDILAASDRPVVDARLYLDAHPMPGRWLPNGCMATSGSLIRWYQSLIGGEDLAVLDSEASERPAASLLCLPYFLGEKSPLHDTDLRGAFVGLHLGHTRADLYRAVLEAIAFGFRHHAEIFGEMGIRLEKVMVTNGGSRSTFWRQIHADVLGIELASVIDHPGASLGAALIAAFGVGKFSGWDETLKFLKLAPPMKPQSDAVAIYDDAYLQWRELGGVLTPVSHQLAARTRAQAPAP